MYSQRQNDQQRTVYMTERLFWKQLMQRCSCHHSSLRYMTDDFTEWMLVENERKGNTSAAFFTYFGSDSSHVSGVKMSLSV
eukprot:m.8795 g.8795  ORF g.8795 m.8795 type:complete len:81 (+) comp5536_c0_seq1:481-723(+)